MTEEYRRDWRESQQARDGGIKLKIWLLETMETEGELIEVKKKRTNSDLYTCSPI